MLFVLNAKKNLYMLRSPMRGLDLTVNTNSIGMKAKDIVKTVGFVAPYRTQTSR